MTLWMLIGLALQPVSPEPPRDLFDQLEGEWVCRQAMLAGGPVFRRESWQGREDGDAQGQIRSFPPGHNGTERPPEVAMLYQRRGRTPRFMYDLTNGRSVRYRLRRGTLQEAVFEAAGNGSPRIISYRLMPASGSR